MRVLVAILLLVACSGQHRQAKDRCNDGILRQINSNQRKSFLPARTSVKFFALIRFVGNAPFAALIAEDSRGNIYRIQKNHQYTVLVKLQGQKICLFGLYFPDQGMLPQSSGSIAVEKFEIMP